MQNVEISLIPVYTFNPTTFPQVIFRVWTKPGPGPMGQHMGYPMGYLMGYPMGYPVGHPQNYFFSIKKKENNKHKKK